MDGEPDKRAGAVSKTEWTLAGSGEHDLRRPILSNVPVAQLPERPASNGRVASESLAGDTI